MEKKVFELPVEWTMLGQVEIEAETLEEAVEIFYSKQHEMPLPKTDTVYLDDSFDLDCRSAYSSLSREEYVKEYLQHIVETQ